MRTDQKERTEDAGIAVVGMRVVEIGSRVALGDCGELFADFATEVLKVAPGGDTTKDRADSRRRAIDTVRADVSHGSTEKSAASRQKTPRGAIPLLFDFRICLILHRFEQDHFRDCLID
jgi:hypothetical protein